MNGNTILIGFIGVGLLVPLVVLAIHLMKGAGSKIKIDWKWVVGAMGVTLLAGGIWWAVGNLPYGWFAQVRNWPYWPQAIGLVVGILLIWFLQSKKLWKPVILLAGLASLIWLGWIWHNMPSKPKPTVEFPGEVPGKLPLVFNGKRYIEVQPGEVLLVKNNSENDKDKVRVIIDSEDKAVELLDELPKHQIIFPNGKIWCKVTVEEINNHAGNPKGMDSWSPTAEIAQLKDGNNVVGFRVNHGSKPAKLAIFVPVGN